MIEASAGAHAMARQLALRGNDVKLISSQFVRPFVKTGKNDFIDAEAICEAASRPDMRFVSPKAEAQQILVTPHRVRKSLVRDKVKATNQMHGFLLKFSVSLPVGQTVMTRLACVVAEHRLPARLVSLLQRLHAHCQYLVQQIAEVVAARALATELARTVWAMTF